MSERDRIGEIADRNKRIETRLVKLCQHMGLDTVVEQCVFKSPCVVVVPNRDVKLAEVLRAIQASHTWMRDVDVVFKGEVIATLMVPKQVQL